MKILHWTLVLAAVAGAHGSPPNSAETKSEETLDSYFSKLSGMRQHWRQQARWVSSGNLRLARSSVHDWRPTGLDEYWIQLDESHRRSIAESESFLESQDPSVELARWYWGMERADFAADVLSKLSPRQDGDQLPIVLMHSLALVEDHQFHGAAALLDGLPSKKRTGDSSRIGDRQRRVIRARAIGQLDLYEFVQQFYLDADMGVVRIPLGLLLEFYDRDSRSVDPLGSTLLESLAQKLGDGGMLHLLSSTRTQARSARTKIETAALFRLGTDSFNHKDYATAITRWQHVVDSADGTAIWPKALFNLGLALEARAEYDEAVAAFSRLRGAEVNDREPGGHIMSAYRNYRPRASWEIGMCRFLQGDVEGALAAYRDTRNRYPFQSWCGNAQWEYEYRYALHEAICLEHLGRLAEAVEAYFSAAAQVGHGDPFASQRLVDLYESAGATDRLLSLCDEFDQYRRSELRRTSPEIDRARLDAFSSTQTIRRIIEIRALGENARYVNLVDLLQRRGRVTGPSNWQDLRDNWIADEAARTLARQPRETLPLLLERVEAGGIEHRNWVFYALGCNGLPDAVDRLSAELAKTANIHVRKSIAFSLTQAGELGYQALDRVDCERDCPPDDTNRYILQCEQGFYPKRRPEPPAIGPDLQLPTELREINEDVRILEALPARVVVDVSSIRATVASWIMAIRIGDREAYKLVVTEEPKLMRVFEDLASGAGGRDPRFMAYSVIAESIDHGDRADVIIEMKFRTRTHRVALGLSMAGERWSITKLDEHRDAGPRR